MKLYIYLVLMGALIAVGCTQTVEQSSAVNAPTASVIELKESVFVPNLITIKRGGTVTWTNKDDVLHTVTGDRFDSGDLAQGEEFTQTFTKTGNYIYSCNYHSGMIGRVIVK